MQQIPNDAPVFIERHGALRTLIAESGVTQDQLADWRGQALEGYRRLAEPLPDTMLWKTQKPQHALDAESDAREIAPHLGLNALETDVLCLLLTAHDLGRLVEAGRTTRKEPRASWLHGTDSENEMKPILGSFADTKLGSAILLAIRHHSAAKPVTLEECDGNEAVWALATVVRDIDKCEGFEQAAWYTADEANKEKQRHQNWPEQIKTDEIWGKEMGRIDPPEMLEIFERHELLPRVKCRSYEAYMLQFLAWTFDIVHPEILKRTLGTGGPIVVRDYIDRRLADEPEQRIRFRTALRNWRRGLMAIA
jgi:hypothetical protein